LRATATMARFFAFLPPRSAKRRPQRRKAVSGPKTPSTTTLSLQLSGGQEHQKGCDHKTVDGLPDAVGDVSDGDAGPFGPEGSTAVGRGLRAGLLLEGERKSAGAMAARLPEGNEQSLQQFLNQSPRDWLPLWRQMAARVERTFPRPVAWIIDDTGFPKKGEHSVGVARQYSGTLGKTGNCQIAVSLHRTDARGSSPLGFRLYLPQEWTDDPARCQAAGVPDEVGFQPNWQLAVELIDQALSWELERPPVMLADAA
jgi:SRSO17 transposase